MNTKKAKSLPNSKLELEIESETETTESALNNDDKALRPKDLPALVRAASQSEADFISVGFGSAVAINRVLAVIAPDSAPIRRLLHEARDKGLLIDATFGRKTKAVLILDSGHVLSVALQPETIIGRVRNR